MSFYLLISLYLIYTYSIFILYLFIPFYTLFISFISILKGGISTGMLTCILSYNLGADFKSYFWYLNGGSTIENRGILALQ